MNTKKLTKGTMMMAPLVAALFSAGLYSAPAHAGFITGQMLPKGTASYSDNRRYGLYIPSTYAQGSAVPLVVVIHGCRINERAMMDGTGYEVPAERDKFIVLYPYIGENDTDKTNDDGGRNPRCWGFWQPTFDGEALNDEIHRDKGEAGDIKRIVDKVKSTYTIDSNRVYVTGISSGGAAVVIQATTYPDVYAAVAPVEGVPYRETTAVYTGTTACSTVLNNTSSTYARATSATVADMRTEMQKSTLRRVPIMVVHNKQDCTVPFPVGEAVKNSFAQLMAAEGKAINVTTPTSTSSGTTDGFPWTLSKYGTGADGQSLIETFYLNATAAQVHAVESTLSTNQYVTTAGNEPTTDIDRGHWWSGGHRGPWTMDKGPSTSEATWGFFKVHTLNSSGGGGTTTTTAAGTTTTTAAATTTTTTATTTTTTAAATCYTSSNYTHVSAGRAHMVITTGHAAANGSNQDMGLDNTFTNSTLKMTGSNYYVVGTCP
ncbi:MAG: extracellular catalytic domain type 1 short-chain-length polyhydroxyalkanoate depolymerase [Burkholderiaceae bacterium]